MVAGPCTTLALFFQPDQKSTNHLAVKDSVVQLIGGASGPLLGVAEEELETVAVSQQGVMAGVAFDGQVLLEEVLDKPLKGS
jgi:hypothetical protein